ncbi:MAG TPA: hypothetical protein DEH78_29155 [Solibacterales bacterium]|nr:hypothetical protein [Bryobacterales bacterium]
MAAPSFAIGSTVTLDGYILKLHFIRGQTPGELEKRIGFGDGRLSAGAWLLFLLDRPGVDDFEYRGYTHFSDGKPTGSTQNAEQLLRAEFGWTQKDLDKHKKGTIGGFQISGPERLAKVVPVIPHSSSQTYPPGSAIPQWKLVKPLRFRVKELIGPGRAYEGDCL